MGQSSNGKVLTQDNNGRTVVGTTAGNQVINIASHDTVDGGLELAGVLVTSSASELNILDGVTVDKDEINLLEGSTSGSVVNGKAVIYGASGEVDMTTLKINGTAITSSANEINILDGITSSTAELNKLTGVESSSSDINKLSGVSPGVIKNNTTAVYGNTGELNMKTLQ